MIKPYNLWKKNLKYIPGGNGLISKRPERFSLKKWPIYYKKCEKIYIWDLNDKKYTDMAQMGIGTCPLGYANKKIDNSVKEVIKNGINSTLNSPEEYTLAKKILKYEKFADKVKFARGGGEAMSIAVRLARSSSKHDQIAFSGYHGWHDWYLATNLKNKNNLNQHLLPGLEPLGVPKSLINSISGFKYNDIDHFKKVVKNKKLAAIIVEGCRFKTPKRKFVNEINRFCKKNKICLIVDEITSGWRGTLGGVYKKFGFKPDVVVYGKGIGNGYAISCIVGKNKILKYADKSFVSSTAWTERVGFKAAISVIDFFENKNAHKKIYANGEYLLKKWKELANKFNLKINFSDFPPLASFYFDYGKKINSKLYTYFTEEMLKHKYLATNSVYVSYYHDKKVINLYLKSCEKIFKEISLALKNKKKLIKIDSRKEIFKRLT